MPTAWWIWPASSPTSTPHSSLRLSPVKLWFPWDQAPPSSKMWCSTLTSTKITSAISTTGRLVSPVADSWRPSWTSTSTTDEDYMTPYFGKIWLGESDSQDFLNSMVLMFPTLPLITNMLDKVPSKFAPIVTSWNSLTVRLTALTGGLEVHLLHLWALHKD